MDYQFNIKHHPPQVDYNAVFDSIIHAHMGFDRTNVSYRYNKEQLSLTKFLLREFDNSHIVHKSTVIDFARFALFYDVTFNRFNYVNF